LFNLPQRYVEVNRLPVGVQLIGGEGADSSLYAIARWMAQTVR